MQNRRKKHPQKVQIKIKEGQYKSIRWILILLFLQHFYYLTLTFCELGVFLFVFWVVGVFLPMPHIVEVLVGRIHVIPELLKMTIFLKEICISIQIWIIILRNRNHKPSGLKHFYWGSYMAVPLFLCAPLPLCCSVCPTSYRGKDTIETAFLSLWRLLHSFEIPSTSDMIS